MINLINLMTSLEVDHQTGCMYQPNRPKFRCQGICDKIWEFVHGIRRPKGRKNHLAHLCNNGHLGCCNIAHLKMQTAKENMAFRNKSGHGFEKRCRDHNIWCKLTIDQCNELNKLLKSGIKESDLALSFNVSIKTISRFRKGLHWSQQAGYVKID
jgi:hypothetical protein